MKELAKHLYFELRWLRAVTLASSFRLRGLTPVFILGVPLHNNIGDLAIACAEIDFINNMKGYAPVPVDLYTLNRHRRSLKSLIRKDGIITTHGGGNMGDTYPEEEAVRSFIIKEFPDRPITVFPQTIHYSDTESGQIARGQASRLYANHDKLTIAAREKLSYKIASRLFADNRVILTPDIVLSMRYTGLPQQRSGVVTCLRADVEKSLNSNDHERIASFAQTVSDDLLATDTMANESFFMLRNKRHIVMRKLAQFSSAELVITDRLHGMVLSVITGTPCIVFSNFNHKVIGTYEWIRKLGYVEFCESIKDLDKVDVTKLSVLAKTYDPSQFSAQWNLLRRAILAESTSDE